MAVAATALPLFALANPDGFIEHRVKQGDTLERLSTDFYGDVKLWPELQKYNQVSNPRHLQPGSILRIPVKYLPLQSAEVSFVQGQATVATTPGAEPAELKAGHKLGEGAEIKVAQDSFVTVKLADGSLIRILAQSDVQLQQLRRKGRAGSLQSVLEMQKGGVNATVGTEPDPTRKFEVRTPRATTSVRGTTFDVSLTDGGNALSSVTHGTVSVQGSDKANAALINEGQGIAVNRDGQLGQAQTLLPSPDLTKLPETMEDSNFLSLQLEPVQQASAYQVQIARDESMSEVLRSGTFPSAQVRMKLVDDGDYYILARAIDDQQLPGMPAKRKLKVKTQPPPPLYQQPAPGGTTSRTSGTLQCTPVSGVQTYRLQVAADVAGFAQPLLDQKNTGDCSALLSSLPVGSYLWRAASIRQLADGSPDQGPFAQPQAFKLANNPATPDLSAMNSAEDVPGLHLQWPGEADQTYRLQLARTEDFAQILSDEKLDKPVWDATDVKPGTYYVRIKTHDTATGLESPFSAARQVRAAAEVQSGYGVPLTSSDGEPLTRK
ncbi:LysM peptidoglycan-binding domain-containing protein [Diaphorobacter sp. HDW4A]|uniref:FecR domain-containing protein n=1 Tax=Diaphorobacter sp. HDW4A TaxID=2714924 RepID=UPI00140DC1AB|nr:FecR domain-containing protein [Diaphorobacter sp. HDW4A]QIL78619.1 LysM peptidoglycan-binding domain-containing protein [Diaphorobacter sp. HDW4A]